MTPPRVAPPLRQWCIWRHHRTLQYWTPHLLYLKVHCTAETRSKNRQLQRLSHLLGLYLSISNNPTCVINYIYSRVCKIKLVYAVKYAQNVQKHMLMVAVSLASCSTEQLSRLFSGSSSILYYSPKKPYIENWFRRGFWGLITSLWTIGLTSTWSIFFREIPQNYFVF